MKRLHILAAEFLISLGIDKGIKSQQILLDFLKYVWEHKDNDLVPLPNGKANKKYNI